MEQEVDTRACFALDCCLWYDLQMRLEVQVMMLIGEKGICIFDPSLTMAQEAMSVVVWTADLPSVPRQPHVAPLFDVFSTIGLGLGLN